MQVEKICEIALTTVVNMRENVQGDTTQKELLEYIKKVRISRMNMAGPRAN